MLKELLSYFFFDEKTNQNVLETRRFPPPPAQTSHQDHIAPVRLFQLLSWLITSKILYSTYPSGRIMSLSQHIVTPHFYCSLFRVVESRHATLHYCSYLGTVFRDRDLSMGPYYANPMPLCCDSWYTSSKNAVFRYNFPIHSTDRL